MTNAYELVEIAKTKQNVESDNALAIALGFTRQNVNDWKTGRSEPKGTNLLKLIKASGLTIDEALELMTEKPLKQAGFANVYLLAGIGATTLAGMSLSAVHYSPESLILSGIAGSVFAALYIIRSIGILFAVA